MITAYAAFSARSSAAPIALRRVAFYGQGDPVSPHEDGLDPVAGTRLGAFNSVGRAVSHDLRVSKQAERAVPDQMDRS